MVGGSGFQPRFIRTIAVKPSTSSDESNRSHNPKSTDTKLPSFFINQTGRFFWPAAGLKPDTRNLKPI